MIRLELDVDPAVAEWLAVHLRFEAAELERTAGKHDRFTAADLEALAETFALAVDRECGFDPERDLGRPAPAVEDLSARMKQALVYRYKARRSGVRFDACTVEALERRGLATGSRLQLQSGSTMRLTPAGEKLAAALAAEAGSC